MRVSKLFWLNGPEPEPMKLFRTLLGLRSRERSQDLASRRRNPADRNQVSGECACGQLRVEIAGQRIVNLPASSNARSQILAQIAESGVALAAFVAGLQV